MQFFRHVAIATLAVGALADATPATVPASAAPPVQAPAAAGGLVVQVRGCHQRVERHHVPEFGYSAWHYHNGRRCRPVEVDDPRSGPGRDCHRDARRHFIPGLGSVVHSHHGRDCSVQVLRRHERPRSPGACATFEGFSFCSN